jgi:TolB protein
MNQIRIVSVVSMALMIAACSKAPAAPATNPDASNPHASTPHASNPHASNPHASNPHASNPHGGGNAERPSTEPLQRDDEPHLRNVQQLTFGGENAEAYFDASGRELSFQSKRGDMKCDAIFRMGADGKNQRRLSSGEGRTTCAYMQPGGRVLYASTHGHGPTCLDEPDRSHGYVWKVYPEFDIWTAADDGSDVKLLYQSKGYDAEATVCHRTGKIVFTSDGGGDLDLYWMNADGSGVQQLTNTPGYDGGAFFSEDCTKMVWRASRPTGEALADYQSLLKQSLVRPTQLEIYVADVTKDGLKNTVQVTNNGKANFAPYLHPDNKRLLFVSNVADPQGRGFDIFLINVDGTGQQAVTKNPSFDGFPMFTPDGKRLVFASNRNNARDGDTNLFIAEWVD